MNKNLYRASALLVLAGVVSCSDVTPVTPTMSVSSANHTIASSGSEEAGEVSSVLADINVALESAGSNVRIDKAELIMSAPDWNGATSTIIYANNRSRGIGIEWVPGDPRRSGRIGVTYAVGSNRAIQPFTRDGGTLAPVPFAQLDAQIEEGMSAWRSQSCAAPIIRVPVTAGTDPDQLDELFNGFTRSANYRQPADIVQAGWFPGQFFRNFAGPSGNNIIGVAFTFVFVDANGPTDIDGNAKRDAALVEIYYNARFVWTAIGSPTGVDFYSIITHETGHALSLGHFGKLFVTRHDAVDGVQLADIKYAPYAIMNAAYVTGRNEIAGTDHSSFCQVWAAAK